MTTAQDAYKRMLRDEIAPALRAVGFKGSGRLYRLDNDVAFARLGFQSSQWNTAEEVRFTVNLMVVSRARWAEQRAADPRLPEVPGPGIEYGRSGSTWSRRLGHLMPVEQDMWWTVGPDETTEVAGEVVAAVVGYGLPAMLAQRSTPGV